LKSGGQNPRWFYECHCGTATAAHHHVRQEEELSSNKRPRRVTVIGRIWVILGFLMLLSAVPNLFPIKGIDPRAVMIRLLPLLAAVNIIAGIVGIYSGINFLKLKAWSRIVLEALTWWLLISNVAFWFVWNFKHELVSLGSQTYIRRFSAEEAIMSLVITVFYGVLLGIMLKFLRSRIVRAALTEAVEQGAEDGRGEKTHRAT
jgi:hypothetical protein